LAYARDKGRAGLGEEHLHPRTSSRPPHSNHVEGGQEEVHADRAVGGLGQRVEGHGDVVHRDDGQVDHPERIRIGDRGSQLRSRHSTHARLLDSDRAADEVSERGGQHCAHLGELV